MKKALLIASLFVLVMVVGVTQAKAATVSVTVTIAQRISISVSQAAWAIGSVAEGGNAVLLLAATNNGNVAEDFSLTTGNSTNWTCGAAAGPETFSMSARNLSDGSRGSSCGGFALLPDNVAPGASLDFELSFVAPSSTSSIGVEQTITVQLFAVKHVP